MPVGFQQTAQAGSLPSARSHGSLNSQFAHIHLEAVDIESSNNHSPSNTRLMASFLGQPG